MTCRSEHNQPGGRLFVLSGPSGVGKDALLSRMRQLGRDFHFTVTATTRPIRPGERDGVDYVFTSPHEFRRLIAENGLLEWAEVYGNLYGVPRTQVTNALERGQNVLLKVDVQGASTVRRLYPESVLIFLEPPDMESLDNRLRERGTEDSEAMRIKLETAREEMKAATWFDYRVINHDDMLDDAVASIDQIVSCETTPKSEQ